MVKIAVFAPMHNPQGGYGKARKTRSAPHRAKRKSKILQHIFHPFCASGIPALVFYKFQSSHRAQGCDSGVLGRQTRRDVFRNLALDVILKLVIEIRFNARTLKERPKSKAKLCSQAHKGQSFSNCTHNQRNSTGQPFPIGSLLL